MKKLIIIIFFSAYTQLCLGQSVYSVKNLQQTSIERLETYLTFAKKQKKTGTIVSIAGASTALAGILVVGVTYDNDELFGFNTGTTIGAWMMLLGMGATVVGIPILITGSTRVNRINREIDRRSNAVSVAIAPCRYTSHLTQNNQIGMTFKLSF